MSSILGDFTKPKWENARQQPRATELHEFSKGLTRCYDHPLFTSFTESNSLKGSRNSQSYGLLPWDLVQQGREERLRQEEIESNKDLWPGISKHLLEWENIRQQPKATELHEFSQILTECYDHPLFTFFTESNLLKESIDSQSYGLLPWDLVQQRHEERFKQQRFEHNKKLEDLWRAVSKHLVGISSVHTLACVNRVCNTAVKRSWFMFNNDVEQLTYSDRMLQDQFFREDAELPRLAMLAAIQGKISGLPLEKEDGDLWNLEASEINCLHSEVPYLRCATLGTMKEQMIKSYYRKLKGNNESFNLRVLGISEPFSEENKAGFKLRARRVWDTSHQVYINNLSKEFKNGSDSIIVTVGTLDPFTLRLDVVTDNVKPRISYSRGSRMCHSRPPWGAVDHTVITLPKKLLPPENK